MGEKQTNPMNEEFNKAITQASLPPQDSKPEEGASHLSTGRDENQTRNNEAHQGTKRNKNDERPLPTGGKTQNTKEKERREQKRMQRVKILNEQRKKLEDFNNIFRGQD